MHLILLKATLAVFKIGRDSGSNKDIVFSKNHCEVSILMVYFSI